MNMHHAMSGLFCIFALAGCASTATDSVATRHVMLIQQPCPAAADEHRPPVPPQRLKNLDPTQPGLVAKAFALSITEHRARADALEKLLNACK